MEKYRQDKNVYSTDLMFCLCERFPNLEMKGMPLPQTTGKVASLMGGFGAVLIPKGPFT